MPGIFRTLAAAALGLLSVGTAARAAEQITLRNGFNLLCDHRAPDGASAPGKVRLYLDATGSNYLDVPASDIVAAQTVTLPPPSPTVPAVSGAAPPAPERLSDDQLRPMLTRAGAAFDIDSDLLASVVRAESGGRARAVSRAGAQGLMQLMPGTAAGLGVANSFSPGQNIDAGSAYLDALLIRYHDDLPLALAAYNAGPASVDRWHGIPPYPETQAYVARVIHEYNRRYRLRSRAASHSRTQLASAR